MKRTKSPRDVCSHHSRRLRLEILERRCLLAVDFVAFNDHLPAGGTHANATSYGTNSGATASGFLKDIDTGLDTPIVLSISSSGPNFAGSSSQPHFSTDAGQIFNGYVDFTSQNGQSIEIQGSQGDFYSHQFSGLNPDRDYEFVGTTVRGNSPYTDRWTLVTLVGADDFTAAHSSGIGVVTDGLAANQVAIWVGHNSLSTQGFVAQWQEIDPGDDGIFEVVSTQYKGPTPGVGSGDSSGGSKGYGLAGIRLIQNVEPTIPAVGNVAAADVSALSAIIGGVVTDTGRQDPDVTLYWGDNDAGTVAGNWDNAVDLGEHSGIFATALSGLDPLSTYYWRSHVENSAGESWAASTSQFTTLPLTLPSVINAPVTDLLPFTAVVNGEVVDAGGDTPSVVIYYGTSDGRHVPWGQPGAL